MVYRVIAAVRVAAHEKNTPPVRLRLGLERVRMYPIHMLVTCGMTAMHMSSPVLQLRTPI